MDIRPINGFPGYHISDTGVIFSKRFVGKPLKPGLIKGYLVAQLSMGGRTVGRTVHSLVAQTYIGPRPQGMQVNHKDGNKLNNCATNLEYTTARENTLHAIALGLRNNPQGPSKIARVDRIGLIQRYRAGLNSTQELASEFGVTASAITWILRNAARWGEEVPTKQLRENQMRGLNHGEGNLVGR